MYVCILAFTLHIVIMFIYIYYNYVIPPPQPQMLIRVCTPDCEPGYAYIHLYIYTMWITASACPAPRHGLGMRCACLLKKKFTTVSPPSDLTLLTRARDRAHIHTCVHIPRAHLYMLSLYIPQIIPYMYIYACMYILMYACMYIHLPQNNTCIYIYTAHNTAVP